MLHDKVIGMRYRVDLHIHTVLSPCGDIEMTPAFIVRRALEAGLGVIAITDHNSTRQAPAAMEAGRRAGLQVFAGAEITTREEAHVVAVVGDEKSRQALQEYLDTYLIRIPNNVDVFGYQLVVDEGEAVVYQEESLLINAIDRSLEQTEAFVRSIGGIFIPAHIDKHANSLISQLGYVPPDLKADALEVSPRCDVGMLLEMYPYLEKYSLIRSSDAHYPDDFGNTFTILEMEEPTFAALKRAVGKKPHL